MADLLWALGSALELLRMRQFHLVRSLVGWALQLVYGAPRVHDEHPRCALASEILHRRKLPVALASAADFILGQPTLQPPECVLADNVSLYCVSSIEAVFVEVPAGCDIYAGARAPSPFLFDVQFALAVRVIRLPLQAMLRLASQLQLEPPDVLLLSNTTRCGSMLLCDMLESVPGMRVLREPDALTCLLALTGIPLDSQRALVRAVVRMLCKPDRGGRATGAAEGGAPERRRVAIKPRGHCIKLLQLLADAVPGCRHLFLYRDGLLTAQSMTRAFCSEPAHLSRHALLQSALVRALFPAHAAAAKGVVVISDDPLLDWARDEAYFTGLPLLAKYALLWAVICRTYLGCRACGLRIAGCRLEDLQADREGFCRRVFDWCGIDAAHAPAAAAAAAQAGDAHGGSIFSRRRLARFGLTAVRGAALRAQLDRICDECGVPRLGEPTLLPGTLGHEGEQPGAAKAAGAVGSSRSEISELIHLAPPG